MRWRPSAVLSASALHTLLRSSLPSVHISHISSLLSAYWFSLSPLLLLFRISTCPTAVRNCYPPHSRTQLHLDILHSRTSLAMSTSTSSAFPLNAEGRHVLPAPPQQLQNAQIAVPELLSGLSGMPSTVSSTTYPVMKKVRSPPFFCFCFCFLFIPPAHN